MQPWPALVLAALRGGFGGLFDLAAIGHYRDPLLVSSTDGVGTKALLAAELGVYLSLIHI